MCTAIPTGLRAQNPGRGRRPEELLGAPHQTVSVTLAPRPILVTAALVRPAMPECAAQRVAVPSALDNHDDRALVVVATLEEVDAIVPH